MKDKDGMKELFMIENPDRGKFWDRGFTKHPALRGPYPCIVGWEPKAQCPNTANTRGYATASQAAIHRWEQDQWSTGIRFYEDVHRACAVDGSQSRTISPTECERLLGFPEGWSAPEEDVNEDTPHQRRNSVGNAFAVPVIARLLTSLILMLCIKPTGSLALWRDDNLACPYRHDVLDDLLPAVACECQGFADLTCDFEDFLPQEWSDCLVGPDPGAGGRKNRAQRSAALGLQIGSHLSRNGLNLLVPEEIQAPPRTRGKSKEAPPPLRGLPGDPAGPAFRGHEVRERPGLH